MKSCILDLDRITLLPSCPSKLSLLFSFCSLLQPLTAYLLCTLSCEHRPGAEDFVFQIDSIMSSITRDSCGKEKWCFRMKCNSAYRFLSRGNMHSCFRYYPIFSYS
ncbi:hypothetical protein BJX76DRAFT_3667 [Aspergillus varians]